MAKKLEISFRVDKDKWQKALCAGWYERTGESITMEGLGNTLDNISDFVWSVGMLAETDVEDLEVMEI